MALWPIRTAGRFLFRVIAVQIYRIFFAIRRQVGKVYHPAKNRFVYMFSNRFAIHFAVVAIAFVVAIAVDCLLRSSFLILHVRLNVFTY